MNLERAAESLIRYLSVGTDDLTRHTGIGEKDFVPVEPEPFEGRIFAVDGSNIKVCDLSVVKANHIRVGYVVYRGRRRERTEVTYNDIFVADRHTYMEWFREPLERLDIDIDLSSLRGSELDRISTYFRELQEYLALDAALSESEEGDLLLYDGGFAIWKDRPFGRVVADIIKRASERGVDLLGVSKSSSLSWGDISMPLVYHVSRLGKSLLPGRAWYLDLSGKNVNPDPLEERWHGRICIVLFHPLADRAFRVDIPSYLNGRISTALSKAAAFSGSSECLGYPHALFRAHHDLKISAPEGDTIWIKMMELIAQRQGVRMRDLRNVTDYHEILDSL
ncbi:MAG: DNA double-strand break repair nuclease NurA [Methanothrix sp.]|uniref:DNA double-strand break repair nuclease NurA n=1 Tax=Methanothrix sp. TaxID=90426 RepID=UPI0025F93CA6|nr:DNA double-strand break repair nuclease NurA [Methanothrix sp.]MCQ8902739.1 DNA double-strand break repair nuclease NurA [Methanothrix sp.]